MDSDEPRSLFSTRYERNLWLLAGAVIAAIYSTIGLATTLSEELTERKMLDNASAAAILVLFAVVFLVGFKDEPQVSLAARSP